jgi:hypothetical protein
MTVRSEPPLLPIMIFYSEFATEILASALAETARGHFEYIEGRIKTHLFYEIMESRRDVLGVAVVHARHVRSSKFFAQEDGPIEHPGKFVRGIAARF